MVVWRVWRDIFPNGGGAHPWKQCTWFPCKSEKRLIPLPLHFQKSLIPRREAQYRFTFSDKWDFLNEILIDTFCLECHIWRILIAQNGAEETFVSKRNLILQWNGDQTPHSQHSKLLNLAVRQPGKGFILGISQNIKSAFFFILFKNYMPLPPPSYWTFGRKFCQFYAITIGLYEFCSIFLHGLDPRPQFEQSNWFNAQLEVALMKLCLAN